MPIYEFCCQDCGKQFETIVFNDNEKVACPECESEKVARQLSGFSVGGGGGSQIGQALPSGGCGSGGFS